MFFFLIFNTSYLDVFTEAAAEVEAKVPVDETDAEAAESSKDGQTNSEVAEEHAETDVANEEASHENGGGQIKIMFFLDFLDLNRRVFPSKQTNAASQRRA